MLLCQNRPFFSQTAVAEVYGSRIHETFLSFILEKDVLTYFDENSVADCDHKDRNPDSG